MEVWGFKMEIDEIPVGRAENLKGQRFGQLIVLYRVKQPEYLKDKNQMAYWKCKCDCGNTTIYRGDLLRSGKVISCGCYRAERLRNVQTITFMPGQHFGHLTILEQGPKRGKNNTWICKCSCGTITEITATGLMHGTQSCGCIKSKGELLIRQLLNNNKLSFINEYSFQDCLGNERPLKFDFYVENCYCIEYDGQQHFQIVPYWGGKKKLIETKKNDNIKNEYCKTHNIPLIRIPYWHYNDITIEDLKPETSQFLMT